MKLVVSLAMGLAVIGFGAARAAAQVPEAAGVVRVTVADPSGAVVPGAAVTIRPAGAPADAAPLQSTTTSETGVAAFRGLAPGRYTIRAGFPGFEIVEVREFRVRAGDNARTVTLPIRRVAEDVTVARDGRTAALDPRGNAFSTVLTREQIEMLPDDPDEMEAALRAMAPPGASFRVDGFSGGRLPPKAQIRSIRLPRMDQFAAQNHGGFAGVMHIDIMTQPGSGPLRGSFDVAFRDDALNAANPFVPEKGDEGLRQGGLSLSGAIVPNRSSFSISVQQGRVLDTTNLLAALPGATVAEAVRRPTDRRLFTGRFDQALTTDHMLRLSYQRTQADSRNLGVGGFDLFERAYRTEAADNIFRVSENGPVGRRLFSESRLQVRWASNASASVFEAPAIRVLDAFTSGGAQRRGGERRVEIEAATDLDYVRGLHSMRAGLLVEGGRYRSDAFSDYLGTYTFASLDDYLAGRPMNYSRRLGDPTVSFSNVQAGAYVQDDYRIHPSVMLSYGLRYEAQSLIGDRNNFLPRVSVSWTPAASGVWTVRAGWGYFTDWLATPVYDQTLRLDGFRQQELNILNPSFPDPGLDGLAPATNRYRLAADLLLPDTQAVNLGLERRIGANARVTATYTHRRGGHVLRGRNLNAPVDGVRPDAAFANVIEVVGDAGARTHMFGIHASLIRLDWRQTFMMVNYQLASSETNATGAFGIPASGDDLSTEWGPTLPRHRFGGSFNMRPFGNFGIALNARVQSGSPYTITTGADDNGDGVFNDRPDGVTRNSARAARQWDLGLRLSYAMGFGGPRDSGTGGGTMVIIAGSGGGMPGGGVTGPNASRYRVEFYASAQNVTNHRNYVGYSGVLTSPFFGQATNVLNPRKIEVGTRFGF
ncbi:MAG TPA: carboxypeptidase regulatory-like domain-containing protein [Vicinamibacterales bacterium]|nr:carboxypeptidase regulatory-like domain-containing protein [Vicinamibacterales bacterium]